MFLFVKEEPECMDWTHVTDVVTKDTMSVDTLCGKHFGSYFHSDKNRASCPDCIEVLKTLELPVRFLEPTTHQVVEHDPELQLEFRM